MRFQYMTLGSFECLCVRSEFGLAVEQYCSRFMQAVMLLAACTKAHRLEARCARWILLAHECLQRVRFEVSQPFLAMALGVKPNALAIFMARLNDQKILTHDGASIRARPNRAAPAIADDLREQMARAKKRNTLRGQITFESFRKYEKFLHRKES